MDANDNLKCVIIGFPGVGKTYLSKMKDLPVSVLDMNPNEFVRADNDWHGDYAKHIKEKSEEYDFLLVGSSPFYNIFNHLMKMNLFCILVYPERELREEYELRYRLRNRFNRKVYELWDDHIGFLDGLSCRKIVLKSSQTLADVMPVIFRIIRERNECS